MSHSLATNPSVHSHPHSRHFQPTPEAAPLLHPHQPLLIACFQRSNFAPPAQVVRPVHLSPITSPPAQLALNCPHLAQMAGEAQLANLPQPSRSPARPRQVSPCRELSAPVAPRSSLPPTMNSTAQPASNCWFAPKAEAAPPANLRPLSRSPAFPCPHPEPLAAEAPPALHPYSPPSPSDLWKTLPVRAPELRPSLAALPLGDPSLPQLVAPVPPPPWLPPICSSACPRWRKTASSASPHASPPGSAVWP